MRTQTKQAFILSVAGSAFFLFLVQPLLARQILPWFGGTAAVWSDCMVFYQVLLLAGYIYAHVLTRLASPRRQATVHAAVVAASLAVLPLGVQTLAQPHTTGGSPGLQIVGLLIRTIGLPYFVLSATSPLLQAWAARLEPEGRVYRLFGWSNLACAIALLCFPFLLEPWLALDTIAMLWRWGYAAWTLAMVWVAVQVARADGSSNAPAPAAGGAPGVWRHVQWLGLSALGCVLLLGVTNHLCQTIAPIPFLWTVPLLVYLLTFVVVFEREWYARAWAVPLAALSALAMSWAFLWLPAGRMLGIGIPIFAGGLFITCLFCHGELAALKPPSDELTRFYVVVATGGALGSLLVAFVAPRLFTSFAELPLALAVLALVILAGSLRRRTVLNTLVNGLALGAMAPAIAHFMIAERHIDAGRNFYGSLYVDQTAAEGRWPAMRKIVHGGTAHGSEFMAPGWYLTPTTYYGPRSAPGLILGKLPHPLRAGIIGLGAGTLSSYGRAGDTFRYYEINPLVVDFARRHFRYLSGTPARTEIALGDGRLELEREPAQGFDVLVVDAFSGDSIPVHLLTREAFAVYRRHLKPGGVVALHVSNFYLDLQPVVAALAADQGWQSIPLRESGHLDPGTLASQWAVVGPADALARLALPGKPMNASSARVWTDQRSSLLTALR